MARPWVKKSRVKRGESRGQGPRFGVGYKLATLLSVIILIFISVDLATYFYMRDVGSEMTVAGKLVRADQALTSMASLSQSHLMLTDTSGAEADEAIAKAKLSIGEMRLLINEVQSATEYSRDGLSDVSSLHGLADEMDVLLDEQLIPAVRAGDQATLESATAKMELIHEEQTKNLNNLHGSINASISNWESSHKLALSWINLFMIGATILAVALAATIGYTVYRRISRRLFKLHGIVEKLAAGRLESRVPVIGNDEISDVAESVNRMATALDGSTSNLRQQEKRMRAIHQSITDGIVVFDNKGFILSMNPAAEAALGRLEKDVAGTTVTGFEELDKAVSMESLLSEDSMVQCWKEKSCTHPDCPSFGSSDLRCWLQCGTHCYNEIQGTFRQKRDACERCEVYRRNGIKVMEADHDERSFKVIISPLLNDEGQEEGRVAVLHDITELRTAERSLRSQNSELLVLNEVAAALTGKIDELDIVLGEALKKVVSVVGAGAGVIASVKPESSNVNIRAFTGIGNHMAAFMGLLPAKAIRELDIDEKTGPPDASRVLGSWKAIGPMLRREGLMNPIIFPFGNPEDTMGVLAVASETKKQFSDQEERLMRSVANQIGVALQNVDLFTRVEKAKNTWETTFDAMADGVFVLDTERHIVMANKVMAEWLDTTPDELVGKKCHEVAHESCDPIGACPFLDVLERGEGTSVEIDEPRLGQSFNVNISPIMSVGGKVIGLVHVMSDISERNRLKEQLLHSEKLAAVGQLVAGVAHELNNPLTGVMGYSQLLLRRFEHGDPEVAHDLQAVIEETERATRIVQNLLSFARKHQPKMAKVDLNSVVEKVLQLRQYQVGVSKVDLQLDLQRSLPETLADNHQLEQVVLNLVNNAIQAVEGVKRPGVVKIRTTCSGDVIRLEIEDNGPGISNELQKRVFDPFFTTKDVGKGTGLGLSICYGIIEEHGGDIEFESQQDVGTTFSFTLPVVDTNVGEAAVDEADAHVDKRRRVLLVDDENAIVDLLSDILIMDGHGVDVAEDCSAALKKLSEYSYDSVITDISISGIDGKELYRRIREIDPKLAANIIFITDDADDAEVRNYLEHTGNSYLVKPFDLHGLRHDIKKVMKNDGN